jgi:signal transduction histidine kinase
MEIRHMAKSLSSKWALERELNKIREQQELRIKNQENALDEAYHALEKIQKLDALGMFAGAVSHDFNNILTAIMGHTELALLETAGNAKLNKRIESIHSACCRAKELVGRILTFCRQDEPEFQDVVLGDVVSDVARLLKPSAGSSVRLSCRVFEGSQRIHADPTQVHQVVMNLCSNAFHAMRESVGTIDIGAGNPMDFPELSPIGPEKYRDSHAVLKVSDTGKGMDEQTMEKMFDPYFTTKGKNEGTGLGLAVVHGIVKKQGGFIHVVSEKGKGTSFYVFFKALGPVES